MIKFSCVMLWLIVVNAVEIGGSQQTSTKKCAKTPDTWKKVEAAIKECQDDVKQKIVKDTFYSNEWVDSIFDYDGHFPYSSGHKDHHSIIDHSEIYDEQSQGHGHHIVDHQSHIHDHHSQEHDYFLHHVPIHHHPQIQDLHPQIPDLNPQIQGHHPQIHDFHPQIQDHHTPIIDTDKNQHFPTLLSYETLAHHPHDHSAKTHHSHDVHQIEAPQLRNPQPFVHSTHTDSTLNAVHMPEEHAKHTTSLSDNPVEQDHYIDLNFFRKKRYANDHGHIHSSTATYHDKRIAGCIMQCIYEKNHATDTLGWPTLDGLVNFYSEGVDEHGYFMATLRAVDYCLKGSSAKYHVNRRSTPENGQTCDVAFDVFDCISDQITEYCSDHQFEMQKKQKK